jgi:molybdopterin/thiamine biosynthesis adenylyltransferase
MSFRIFINKLRCYLTGKMEIWSEKGDNTYNYYWDAYLCYDNFTTRYLISKDSEHAQ